MRYTLQLLEELYDTVWGYHRHWCALCNASVICTAGCDLTNWTSYTHEPRRLVQMGGDLYCSWECHQEAKNMLLRGDMGMPFHDAAMAVTLYVRPFEKAKQYG